MTHSKSVCLLALLMLAPAGSTAVYAQTTTSTQRFTAPFFVDDINPCTGEPVSLSGEVLITTHTTIDSNGAFHGTFRLVPQHVIGEGVSGVTYRAVGGHREHLNEHAGGTPLTFTLTNTFNMVSQGPLDDYFAFTVIHVTVGQDGTVKSETAINRLECRG